jgi:hypothetical protein
MGIALSEIPAVGTLLPAERRELARWLRSQVARGAVIDRARLQDALDASAFALVTVGELVAVEWLAESASGLSADTYARRVAAGAVDGDRMTLGQAGALAVAVSDRVQQVRGELGGVRIIAAVLYGSAVRSVGNTKPDIGDLDLALEIEVTDAGLLERLQVVPPAQRWREAIVVSGWAEHLMQGDDRITLAGSLARVLALFNRQLHGFDVPADGRAPAALTLWTRSTRTAPKSLPALDAGTPDELAPCPAQLRETLAYLEGQTVRTQARAEYIADLLAAAPVFTKQITWFGRPVTLACDGKCGKAWGITKRPNVRFDENEPDDSAMLADHEVGLAPADPQTYEGGCAKPTSPAEMNRWCSRQCERSSLFEAGEPVKVKRFDQRRYNQPWKHDGSAASVAAACAEL